MMRAEDLAAHVDAWRTALLIARDIAGDPDDQRYWQREIDEFDRVISALQATE